MSLMLIVGALFQLILIGIVIYGFVLLTRIEANLRKQTDYLRKIEQLLERPGKSD